MGQRRADKRPKGLDRSANLPIRAAKRPAARAGLLARHFRTSGSFVVDDLGMELNMNIDTLAGEGTDLKGRFKETVGRAVGDSDLQAEGAADQVSGSLRKAFGGLRDFVRERPVIAGAAALVLGAALFRRSRRSNTAS